MSGEPDSPTEAGQRLSRIATLWTQLDRAHSGGPQTISDAQKVLVQRYCGAVYRYLLGALRDEDAAMELFQEFALRLLRGDFKSADASRGRFRDYLKSSLSHLITDHRRARGRQPLPLVSDPPARDDSSLDAGEDFTASWRRELMNHTWDALASEHPVQHAVLLYHVQNPNVESTPAASELSEKLGRPMTATNVRVTLHRARERFVELLIAEVESSLQAPDPQELLDELRELKLLKLCGAALAKRGLPTEAT